MHREFSNFMIQICLCTFNCSKSLQGKNVSYFNFLLKFQYLYKQLLQTRMNIYEIQIYETIFYNFYIWFMFSKLLQKLNRAILLNWYQINYLIHFYFNISIEKLSH